MMRTLQRWFAGALSLWLSWNVSAQPDEIFINRGVITEAPQIDATRFHNIGTFNSSVSFASIGGISLIGSADPYTTQHTLYYTNANSGFMTGSVGYEFKYFTPTNVYPTDSFYNYGRIDVGTFLLIDATNVFSSGLLAAGQSGIVKIRGDDVNLSRGALRTGIPPENSTGGQGQFNHDAAEYTNPAGVTDLYWGNGENGVLSGVTQGAAPLRLSFLAMPNPQSPSHQVLDATGRTNRVALPVSSQPRNWAAYANTNKMTDTNYLIQVVFVRTNVVGAPDTNFWVDAKFGATPFPTSDPLGRISMVEFSFWDIDVVTGFPFTNRLYFIDRAGALTNTMLYTNAFNTNLSRPLPYEISLTPPNEWATGAPGNAPYNNNLISSPTYLATQVTNAYIAYSASFGSTTSSTVSSGFAGFFNPFFFQQTTALSDPTNQPGRIEIDARTLQLKEARIRGEGLVTIRGDHYTGDAPRKIDSPLMAFDLGTTNGTLRIEGAVPDSVRRFSGNLNAWTGIWTNQIQVVVPPTDPMSTESTTNTIDIMFHVLVLDHTIQTIRPVSVRDFVLRADNHIEVADRISVSRALSISGDSMNLRGQLILSDQLPDLVASNFLGMLYFTNSGVLSAPSTVNFGNDREQPFVHIANRGNISGASIFFRSENIENSGNLTATGGRISLQSTATKFDGGRITAPGDVYVSGAEIKGRRSTITAGSITTNPTTRLPEFKLGKLLLEPSSMLTDGGLDASNKWSTLDGFQLLSRPQSGDLLGTELTSSAVPFAEVTHVWAAEDRGADSAGYTNNSAVGRLKLDGGPFGSLMTFKGLGTQDALYVDYLTLANYATNVDAALNIHSNITIYFAASTPSAQQLDGKFGGRLRWVRNYAGANSSTNLVLSDGRTVTANIALVTSSTIDSDADGVPNSLDSNPFDGPRITTARAAEGLFLISWRAAASTTYTVEYRSLVTGTNWLTLATHSNDRTNSFVLTHQDPIPAGSAQRYYRVTYKPY